MLSPGGEETPTFLGKYLGFVENNEKYCDSGYIYSVTQLFPDSRRNRPSAFPNIAKGELSWAGLTTENSWESR